MFQVDAAIVYYTVGCMNSYVYCLISIHQFTAIRVCFFTNLVSTISSKGVYVCVFISTQQFITFASFSALTAVSPERVCVVVLFQSIAIYSLRHLLDSWRTETLRYYQLA